MSEDRNLARAIGQVEAVGGGTVPAPAVRAFFDEATFTASYVVHDPATRKAAVVDSVLDFDPPSGRTCTASADAIVAYVEEARLTVDWLLETHVHADHLSAAAYLQKRLGGALVISKEIVAVQETFGALFNEGEEFARDGSQFDRLLVDGDTLDVGTIPSIALHVPGHTPTDMAYLVGDALFTGDTIFMPDYGSARTDFPNGDARTLYRSVRRLMELPGSTRVFLCHDYKAPGRDAYAWETEMAAQRAGNIHLRDGIAEDEFVAMRSKRDATLPVPKLMLAAIQVNMRGGRLPPPDANGVSYLKLPINQL